MDFAVYRNFCLEFFLMPDEFLKGLHHVFFRHVRSAAVSCGQAAQFHRALQHGSMSDGAAYQKLLGDRAPDGSVFGKPGFCQLADHLIGVIFQTPEFFFKGAAAHMQDHVFRLSAIPQGEPHGTRI